jgi:hypothetical protein
MVVIEVIVPEFNEIFWIKSEEFLKAINYQIYISSNDEVDDNLKLIIYWVENFFLQYSMIDVHLQF